MWEHAQVVVVTISRNILRSNVTYSCNAVATLHHVATALHPHGMGDRRWQHGAYSPT